MVNEAISIEPESAAQLHDVGRLLQSGSAHLVGPEGEQAPIPAPLYDLLKDIVRNLEDGRELVLIPGEKQLSTQQAAEFIGFSDAYISRLLDEGKIPYRMVGKHRRISLRDALAYRKEFIEMQRSLLGQMARDAWAAGLYDNCTIPEGGSYE